jgi:hypothetical protein
MRFSNIPKKTKRFGSKSIVIRSETLHSNFIQNTSSNPNLAGFGYSHVNDSRAFTAARVMRSRFS